MRLKYVQVAILTSIALGLSSCDSNAPKTEQTVAAKPVASKTPSLEEGLIPLNYHPLNKKVGKAPIKWVKAVRYQKKDSVILRLLERGANPNQIDSKTGFPLFFYIATTRSPKVVQKALEKGADPLVMANGMTVHDFAKKVYGIKGRTTVEWNGLTFGFTGHKNTATGNLSDQKVSELIENYVLIASKAYELNEAKKRGIQLSIAKVPEPILPAVQKIKKSPFETLHMFQVRMQAAKDKRRKQTEAILTDYRQKVQARNDLVAKNIQAYKQLQRKIGKHQPFLVAKAMAAIYGVPSIHAIVENGQPKYDAEHSLMYARLGYSGVAAKQDVTFKIPPGKTAETFYTALKNNQLQPKVFYNFTQAHSGTVVFNHVEVAEKNQTYIAKAGVGSHFVTQKPLEVVLKSTQSPVQVAQTNASLQMQNPNIKDVQFEAYVLREQKAYQDDIPRLLAKTKAAPIDRKKWLFVIGIGNYSQTDDILYSRRSAEMFAKVASKTLGIQKGRKIVLLDGQASSGRIKDELKLMLSKVKPGDKIYFYYSGHGIPVVSKGNAPYILPADKIPDFVADDDFYQAQNIYKMLKNSRASQVIAFMDSCFTGTTDGKSVFSGAKAATRLTPKTMRFNQQGKMAVITAGNDKQYSNAYPKKGERLFSYYLMKAMLQHYKNVGDLATKVKAGVTETSIDMGGLNRQTPVIVGNTNLLM